MHAISLAFAIALLAPLPIQPPDPIAPVQYAHRGPADAIALDPGDSAVVPLEKGAHDGLDVVRSEGIVTPRCPVAVASAQVVADGEVATHLDLGVRAGNWSAVMEGGPLLPMTAVPLMPGQSLRLRVTNPGPARVTVSPFRTRLAVYAASCAPADRPGLAGW